MVPSYFTTVFVDVPSKRPSALKEEINYRQLQWAVGMYLKKKLCFVIVISAVYPLIAKILYCLHSQLFPLKLEANIVKELWKTEEYFQVLKRSVQLSMVPMTYEKIVKS